MDPIEIIHTTPSKITIRSGKKTATIFGEALTRTPGQPDFIIYANSLKIWSSEKGSIEILQEEHDTIITKVVSELRSRGWAIDVED
jgi:hypothetical protein